MDSQKINLAVDKLVAEGQFKRNNSKEVRGVKLSGKPDPKLKSFTSWLRYSFILWDLIQRVHENKVKPKWEDLTFREESDFYAGSYFDFSLAWLPAIHQLPNDKTKDLAYRMVHSGVDLFSNLAHIPAFEPASFRTKHKIYTKYITHPYNRELFRKGSHFQGEMIPTGKIFEGKKGEGARRIFLGYVFP